MDDLMNKVGALIEEHVKSEVDARERVKARNDTSLFTKDEIRRGTRALGFWEKLVETLCVGPADEETFEHVMEKIQALKEERDELQRNVEASKKQIEVLCGRIDTVRKDRDEAQALAKERLVAIDNLRAVLKDERFALDNMRDERDKYRTMWEQLHRAQGGDLEAKEQLKELLSALGLAHFTSDRLTIAGALEATRKRDARLCAERDDARAQRDEVVRQLQSTREKVQALESKLLEVRKAVGERARPKVDDKVRCGHWHGVVIGFRVEDGGVMVRRTYNGGSELRYLKAEELEVIAP